MVGQKLKHDEVGPWSEVKLEIVKKYAAAYSTIITAKGNFRHVYIDAFAGAGEHVSKETGDFIPGSPLNALHVKPPFKEFHFIDLDTARVENLTKLAQEHQNVHVHEGDCNEVLLNVVFPRVKYDRYERALCLLDPYGLTLDWRVLVAAGQSKAIEVFLNFPVMDMNRNILRSKPDAVAANEEARMTAFWGDDSWKSAAYSENQALLFGGFEKKKRPGNEPIVESYRKRLRDLAGFKNVPEPMPMRNSIGAVVYYLFFASQNDTGNKIVKAIFNSYGMRGAT